MLQFLALLTGAFCGALDGPVWMLLPVVLTLAAPGFIDDWNLASRYARLGTARVLTTASAMTLANSIAFAAATFAMGQAIAWLAQRLLT